MIHLSSRDTSRASLPEISKSPDPHFNVHRRILNRKQENAPKTTDRSSAIKRVDNE